ncbi:unnamed protein product [Musa acuminata subsp. burmannicoides]
MDPVDVVPSGYRFLPTAEELVVDYLANCVAGTPLPSRAVAFADVYGTEPWNLLCNDRQEGYFFARAQTQNSGGSRVDRRAGTGSWTLNKSKNPSSPSSTGARWWWDERASLLQRWPAENSGWNMYEYEMCSRASRRVLCHVKKSSHHAISGGNFIKRLSRRSRRPRQRRSPAAASLGRREIERNLLISQQKHRLSQRSQHIHCSPTSHHLQPRWCNIPYRLVL